MGINNFGVFLGNNVLDSQGREFPMTSISSEIAEYYVVAKEYVK